MGKLIELLRQNPFIVLVVGAWVVNMVSNILKAQKNASRRRAQENQPRPLTKTQAAPPVGAQVRGVQVPGAQPGGAQPGGAQAGGAQAGGASGGRVVARMGTGQQQRLAEQGRAQVTLAQSPRTAPARSSTVPKVPQPQVVSADEQITREMRRILGLQPESPGTAPARLSPQPVAQPELIPMDSATVQLRADTARQQRGGKRRSLAEELQSGKSPSGLGKGLRERHVARSKVGRSGPAMGGLGGRAPTTRRSGAAGRRYSMHDLRRAFVMSEILAPPVSMRQPDERTGL